MEWLNNIPKDEIDLDLYHSPTKKGLMVEYRYYLLPYVDFEAGGTLEVTLGFKIFEKSHSMTVGEWVEDKIRKDERGNDFKLISLQGEGYLLSRQMEINKRHERKRR